MQNSDNSRDSDTTSNTDVDESRRRMLATVATVAFAGAMKPSVSNAQAENEGNPVPRRVLTGRDENGLSFVESFDVTPRVIKFESAPGLTFYEQYSTEEIPSLTGKEPDPMLLKEGKRIPPNGTLFRLISFPPAAREPDVARDASNQFLKELEEKVPDLAGTFDPNTPGMHTTDTLDYVVVIRGEIILELDDGKITHLRPGDCVVQNGTRHRWINPHDVPCLVAAVMIGGQRQ